MYLCNTFKSIKRKRNKFEMNLGILRRSGRGWGWEVGKYSPQVLSSQRNEIINN